jgi:hypothetical protein
LNEAESACVTAIRGTPIKKTPEGSIVVDDSISFDKRSPKFPLITEELTAVDTYLTSLSMQRDRAEFPFVYYRLTVKGFRIDSCAVTKRAANSFVLASTDPSKPHSFRPAILHSVVQARLAKASKHKHSSAADSKTTDVALLYVTPINEEKLFYSSVRTMPYAAPLTSIVGRFSMAPIEPPARTPAIAAVAAVLRASASSASSSASSASSSSSAATLPIHFECIPHLFWRSV